jgi:nucleoside-diphosphate-sugar epimerase
VKSAIGPTRHRVAIIGGSGFIGSRLSKAFSNTYEVTVFDVAHPREKSDGRFEPCDVRDRDTLVRKLDGFDLAVNAAIVQVPQINEQRKLGFEVNVLGVQNICQAVESVESLKGFLHVSSWHVFGEKDLKGNVDEEYGLRPDKIEERARLYALSKITQEALIRIFGTASTKSYGIIRIGTVLGDGMPKQTAANIFIENALMGRPLTPFRHTQYRPMLYVDINDVCKAFDTLAAKILTTEPPKDKPETQIFNLMYPRPITIINLARIVQRTVTSVTHGRIRPTISVIDQGAKPLYSPRDVERFRSDISKARRLLDMKKLTPPEQTIKRIVTARLESNS